jgi:DNA polymerase-3 subunit epsilon
MRMQYAIVDIETTGGSARGSRMTEIAIRIMDGVEVVESWQSLINPKQPIPPAIFALTGITDEMVEHAPEFAEIADQVFRLLDGKIFVAHHVNFDYSFVKHQLEECGIRWSAPKLCTVRLARKIYPGLASYSLGRLCDYLGIPILHRHRAGGDADATAILFAKLLQADQGDVVKEMVKKSNPQQRLPAHLNVEEFENLPNSPGVYYFHNQAGKVIYVGKAVKLKSRVGTHFTGHPTHLRRQQFLKEIHHISYEICATELMALLLECIEIKRLWPAYNRALKRFDISL